MSSAEPVTAPNLNAVGVSISFTVNDLTKSRHFYTTGLGFEVEAEHEVDGVVRFVQMRSGDVQLGIGQDDFAKGSDRVKGAGFRTWIVTSEDIHAVAARAKTAGITLDNEPEELPWGAVGFGVTDPDGFMLTISDAGW